MPLVSPAMRRENKEGRSEDQRKAMNALITSKEEEAMKEPKPISMVRRRGQSVKESEASGSGP